MVLIPEVGDEVLVAFDGGELRAPCGLGTLWNGAAKPPLTNADGNNDERVLNSRKGHTLRFDDGSRELV